LQNKNVIFVNYKIKIKKRISLGARGFLFELHSLQCMSFIIGECAVFEFKYASGQNGNTV